MATQSSILYTSLIATLQLVHKYPLPPEHRLSALPITAHFYEQGRSIMVGFLDSRELWVLHTHDTLRSSHHSSLVSGMTFIHGDKSGNRSSRHRCTFQISLTDMHDWSWHSGNSAYHEATGTLLVWNLIDGMDVYNLTAQQNSATFVFSRKININFWHTHISHICLDASGRVAICGSDMGEVYIYEVSTGSLRQVLPHGTDLQIVQTLAASTRLWAGADTNQFAVSLIYSLFSSYEGLHSKRRLWSWR